MPISIWMFTTLSVQSSLVKSDKMFGKWQKLWQMENTTDKVYNQQKSFTDETINQQI